MDLENASLTNLLPKSYKNVLVLIHNGPSKTKVIENQRLKSADHGTMILCLKNYFKNEAEVMTVLMVSIYKFVKLSSFRYFRKKIKFNSGNSCQKEKKMKCDEHL